MASRRLPSSERENMDLSGVIAPSTTTISTVAVQAGRSKVVLAVLRVGDRAKSKTGDFRFITSALPRDAKSPNGSHWCQYYYEACV
ncbi:hypothetical protein PoB_006504200 [Plakobranchus ocellatus]|uniref:Uncharacterized protein n=1 Tax=Plakobranchus ocellatus TaxID=259542 RepID=A0AAV4D2Z3_9GAST|nr:hypothetical protein PoB_006504200 [Plakobranchus ocellatus]